MSDEPKIYLNPTQGEVTIDQGLLFLDCVQFDTGTVVDDIARSLLEVVNWQHSKIQTLTTTNKKLVRTIDIQTIKKG